MRRAFALVAAGSVATAVLLLRESAEAQRVDPRRPASFAVGPAPGPYPMARVDGARSGRTRAPLPSGTLRVAWQKATNLTLDQPVLAGSGGLAVVSIRGDVSFLDETGEERGSVKGGSGQSGPAAMTSDGTVVFATSTGDIVGVRRSSSHPRFVVRVAGPGLPRAAPLPLDDGGIAVATATDIVLLDSEGNLRSRVTLPEVPSAPLVSAGDKILAISASGTVYGWVPGRDAVRIGSFGGAVDGGAALTESGTLVAVVAGNRISELDLARGTRSTRAIESSGLYLGPPAVRTTAPGSALATLLALSPTRGFVVSVEPGGQEVLRAPISSFTLPLLPDGGTPALVAPAHLPPLVDHRGTIAFAATDGHVGVIGPDGAVDTLGETFCARGSRSGMVGLTPFAAGSFVVTCDGGTVLTVTGQAAPSAEAPKPGADSDKLRRPAEN